METNLQYSIIYAIIRPEIAEKLSLGVLAISKDKIEVKYSQNKLNVLKMLYTPKEYKFISQVVRKDLQSIDSVGTLKYLTRYSNNLIAFSPIQSIDTSTSGINADWLYRNYVFNKRN